MVDRLDGIVATTLLPAERVSAGEARRFVQGVLRDIVSPADLEAVVLLTSEVVTNAVMHAGTAIDLVVRTVQGCIQIESSDQGDQTPVVLNPASDDGRGRGMKIIDALSQEWGVTPTARGKTVWFRYQPGLTPQLTLSPSGLRASEAQGNPAGM
jgi:anti-sigma regulatory factor (Ser/Thr protein kinase)